MQKLVCQPSSDSPTTWDSLNNNVQVDCGKNIESSPIYKDRGDSLSTAPLNEVAGVFSTSPAVWSPFWGA